MKNVVPKHKIFTLFFLYNRSQNKSPKIHVTSPHNYFHWLGRLFSLYMIGYVFVVCVGLSNWTSVCAFKPGWEINTCQAPNVVEYGRWISQFHRLL